MDTINLINNINDPDTFNRAIAERAMLKTIEGDCNTAVAGLATIEKDLLNRLDKIWPGPGGAAPEAYAW